MDSPPPPPPPPTTRPRSNTFSGGTEARPRPQQPPTPTIATMRQHLRSVGHGDLIDPLAAVLLQSPRGPRRSSSEANIRAGPSYGALAKRPGHKQALSAYLRLEFLRSGRAEVSPPPMLAHDDVEARSPPRRSRAAPSFDYPQFRTDVMATCVAFVVTCVIYASTAQAIFGKLDPRLVFVGVDGALLGTALTGVVFALRSQVPWCIASTDVGFAPLLAQLADQCWKNIAPTKKHTFEVWSFEEDGALSYAAVPADTRRDFVATWVAASSLIFLLCGGVLWALGAFKLTRVVNFMPYPVISGMLASIGVSLCKSGARVAAAPGFRVSHELGILWLSCALVLALFMRLARRSGRVPSWLPPVAVVLVSSVAMYLGILIYDVDASEAAEAGGLFDWDPAMLATARGWAPLLDINALGGPIQVENVDDDAEIGAAVTEAPFCVLLMRRASLKHLSHRFIQGLAAFATHVQWQVVFQCRGVILAAVTLGAIKIGLKTGAFPALFPNEAICADAEVAMVGFSNVCLGLLGVQGVAYSFSSLKLAEQVGASRRGVGLCLPLLCLLCWALGYAFLRHVPRFACGALLLDLGWDYVDTYLVGQISRGVVWTDVDVLAVFAVVATAIAASLLEAVAVGVVLCLAGTASRLARESVVAATLSGVDARSAVERSSRAQRRLDALGDAIRVLRLRGHVFFGSAPEVLSAATQRLDDPVARPLEHLVVDLEDCQTRALDLTAVETFQRLASLGDALGFRLCVAPALDLLVASLPSATFFDTADDALESCEDAVLDADVRSDLFRAASGDSSQSSMTSPKVGPGAPPHILLQDWLRANDADEAHGDASIPVVVAALAPSVGSRRYHAGEIVYSKGDPRDAAFYLVCVGRLRLMSGNPQRCVRKLGRGNAVGVGEFYGKGDDGPRSDTLVASTASTILRLPHDAVRELDTESPRAALYLHHLLARTLSGKNSGSKKLYRHNAPNP